MPTKDVSKKYVEVQVDPLSPAPSGFDNVDISDIITQVREWLFANFEDPVEHTPHDSREGGYQYIWGGPYNTRDIIENIFADELSDEQIEEVVDDIEVDGLEWVPNQRRVQAPEEDDEGQPPPPTTAELHAHMLALVAEARQEVEKLDAATAPAAHGIGHNNPPDAIDENAPASKRDIADIKAALEALNRQPEKPDEEGQKEAEKAKTTLSEHAKKLAAWAAKKVAGHIATFAAGGVAAYLKLPTLLQNVVDAVGNWLASINLPF